MIIDGTFPAEVSEQGNTAEKAVASFLKFIEKRLGVAFVRNTHGIPETMLPALRLAEVLRENGIIKSFGQVDLYPDVPHLKSWYAICNDPTSHMTGGSSWESNADALMGALAEALERYIWFLETDYFVDPRMASSSKMQARGLRFVRPEHFAGFSDEQRKGKPQRELHADDEYLWLRGTSLVKGTSVYLPAQTVSGVRRATSSMWKNKNEPDLRQSTTIGLATWPTKTGARLAGALEAIERDAYMIAWINQLTLPRYSLSSLKRLDPVVARVIEQYEQYRFRPHVVKLITDAPTHVVAVMLEDLSGNAPRFSIGLRAHRSLAKAVLKAASEAARGHRGYLNHVKNKGPWDITKSTEEVGHYERVGYWGVPEHAKHLEFFVNGKEIDGASEPWDKDSEEEHLRRIVEWCGSKGFECAAFTLGTSAKNPTSLFVEMVVIPELQPAYLMESVQTFGGTRWKEVPKMFGYTRLEKPFGERPHPFA